MRDYQELFPITQNFSFLTVIKAIQNDVVTEPPGVLV